MMMYHKEMRNNLISSNKRIDLRRDLPLHIRSQRQKKNLLKRRELKELREY
jgi:hypothetical protein